MMPPVVRSRTRDESLFIFYFRDGRIITGYTHISLSLSRPLNCARWFAVDVLIRSSLLFFVYGGHIWIDPQAKKNKKKNKKKQQQKAFLHRRFVSIPTKRPREVIDISIHRYR